MVILCNTANAISATERSCIVTALPSISLHFVILADTYGPEKDDISEQWNQAPVPAHKENIIVGVTLNYRICQKTNIQKFSSNSVLLV